MDALDFLEMDGDGGSLPLNRLRLLAEEISIVKLESSSLGDSDLDSWDSLLAVSDCAGEKSLMPQMLSQSFI